MPAKNFRACARPSSACRRSWAPARALLVPPPFAISLVSFAPTLLGKVSKRVRDLGQRQLHHMLVAGVGQQLADACDAIGFAPIRAFGQRRPDEAQQCPQTLQAATRIVNGGRNIVAARKSRFGNVDLFHADAAGTGGHGLVQLEAVSHAPNNTHHNAGRVGLPLAFPFTIAKP